MFAWPRMLILGQLKILDVKNSFTEKNICYRYTLELSYIGNSNVYLQRLLLKKGRKLFGNLHFTSIMPIVFTSVKHPKLPISIKIPVTLLRICLYLHEAISPNSSSWTTSLLSACCVVVRGYCSWFNHTILTEYPINCIPGHEFIKLEFILRLKIKRNNWLLADTCPQAANHCTLFWVWECTQAL